MNASGLQASGRPSALMLLRAESADQVYGPAERAALAGRAQLLAPQPLDAASALARPDLLAATELLFTGWGCPKLDASTLAAMPRLRAVFYAAGTLREVVTPEFWDRGIPIVTAAAANAVPVSEFSFAAIILGLKRAFHHAAAQRQGAEWWRGRDAPGAYRATVGLVSMGAIARLVRSRLRSLDVTVLAYDPLLTAGEARSLDVELVELATLFAHCDAVSVHAPALPATRHLIRGSHLAAMRQGAAFINTARGSVVHESEMIDVLRARPDLQAVLDVTEPEPPAPDSPLRSLPSVFLTPHLAGSVGGECARLGALMLEELDRWLAGQPLQHAVTRERAELMA